jgi:uncharacterized protein
MEVTSYLTDALTLAPSQGIASLFCLKLCDALGVSGTPEIRRKPCRRRPPASDRAGQNRQPPRPQTGNPRPRCYLGAMNPSGYRAAIIDYVCAQAKPPDKFSHQPRLYRLATRLAEDRPYDDDVLFAAAWLHDLGVFIGHRPEDPVALAAWDHVAYAVVKVPPILQQCGFPKDKIPAAVEAIRTHLPSGKPTTFEGSLLRDADLLEQLGAVAVLRTVSKVGRDTRFARHADALAVLRRNLQQLPTQLELASARRLAQPRIEALQAFLATAETEAEGIEF